MKFRGESRVGVANTRWNMLLHGVKGWEERGPAHWRAADWRGMSESTQHEKGDYVEDHTAQSEGILNE